MKEGGSEYEERVHEFISQIMREYTCEEVHQHPQYEQELYHLMELTLDSFNQDSSPLLKWVSNPDSLWFLEKVALDQVVNCNTHPNLFIIIR